MKRSLILACVAILLLISMACTGCVSVETAKKADPRYIREGAALYSEGRYEEAISSFDKYLREDRTGPDAVYAWWGAAVSYEEMGRYDEALRCIEMAISIAPENSNLWYAKARILSSLGRHQESMAALKRAEEISKPVVVPATTITPAPTGTEVIETPVAPEFNLTEKDLHYLRTLGEQLAALQNLSMRGSNVFGSEYRTYGIEFRTTAEGFLTAINGTEPDDPVLRESREKYQEALQAYILAGTSEEIAGIYFEAGDYNSATGELRQAASQMQRANALLSEALERLRQGGF